MQLRQLISSLTKPSISGGLDIPVTGLTADSRKVEPGFLFAAIRGTDSDGTQFIGSALEAGAGIILSETAPPADLAADITWIHVSNARLALAHIASEFYGNPTGGMRIAGVTGTNGKTTTSYLLHFLLRHEFLRAGMIGTIKFDNGLEQREATHTTPGPIETMELMGEMRDNGCKAVAMEVSSHALDQDRTAAINFDVAVFTNFTQDHLDYHGSMENYFQAKRRLFEQLKQSSKKRPTAVINIDDPKGQELAKWCEEEGIKTLTYGYGVHVDVRGGGLLLTPKGAEFEINYKGKQFRVRTPLIGRYNVTNTLGALAAAIALRLPLRDCVSALADLPQVPGRLERVDTRRGKHVYIDYAHTPDALENVCSTLKNLDPNRLITVFGCGGDRDRSKRPLMAAAAERFSDFCIITSDNPRTENPDAIINEVAKGMTGRKFAKVVDRTEALEAALRFAKPGDIVLVAGKGHEPYQEIDGVRHPFRDHSKIRGIMARIEEDFKEQMEEKMAARDAERRAEGFGDRPPRGDREERRDGDKDRVREFREPHQPKERDPEEFKDKKNFSFRDEEPSPPKQADSTDLQQESDEV